MSKKSAKIAALIEARRGHRLDAHYLGYFDCFHRQLFYEAHDVLEEVWLEDRHGPNGSFYKGLIQLAGAFVHIQKGRLGPASALFNLAESNLLMYGAVHEHLEVTHVLTLIQDWLKLIQQPTAGTHLLNDESAPKLTLREDAFARAPQ